MAESAGDILGPIDAETGNVTQFTSVGDDGGANSFTATEASKNNGTYGFAAVFNGVHDEAWGAKTFANQTGIYVRFYTRIDTSVIIAQWESITLLEINDSTTDLLTIRVDRSTAGTGNPERWSFLGENLTSAALAFGADTPMNTWIQVEAYWLAGNPGQCKVWMSNDYVTPLFSDTDPDTSVLAADSIKIGSSAASAIPDAGIIYFDDIKGSTTGPIGIYTEAGGASIIPMIMNSYRRLRA